MWTNFQRGTLPPVTEHQIDGVLKTFPKLTRETVMKSFADVENDKIWINNLYQVNIRELSNGVTHLSIKRRDKDRIGPERYRHFMRIKDELVDPEREAVEIYPARSREVDVANQYHVWVLPKGAVVPFGFNSGRAVSGISSGGARQHPLEEEQT